MEDIPFGHRCKDAIGNPRFLLKLHFPFSWCFKWSHFIKKISNSIIKVGEAGVGVSIDVTYIIPTGVAQLISKFSLVEDTPIPCGFAFGFDMWYWVKNIDLTELNKMI